MVTSYTIKQIRNLLYIGDYHTIYSLTKDLSFTEIKEILLDFCLEKNDPENYFSGPLSVYFFMQASLFIEETAEKHDFMADITIAFPADFYVRDGAITLGMNHLKRACELDPTNIQYKEWLLGYYDRFPGGIGQYLNESEADMLKTQIAELKSKLK